jgi:hypothetical protein
MCIVFLFVHVLRVHVYLLPTFVHNFFNTSSMFELHMVVASVVMFNILELTMELVSNFPTN